ncbi:hypothetical protein [Pseudopontixanthobacter vadosimaris]|uniref:hypothetical protein n=1 Tax=Pseudopontixanthobacter vadosimaris TaxID=2726450 RepID=UPI0014735176|nr:hypothetical protein [Pseudopontixanthobacter vadosimaris]
MGGNGTIGRGAAMLLGAALALLLLLIYAWFDGGEEPVRPITQPVDLPEQA